MTNLKKMAAGALAGAIALAPGARANWVVLTQNAFSYSVGGEFNAVTSQSFLANYSPLAIVGNGFETICLETAVDFYPGNTYSYSLGSVDSLGRNLTEGAAFLYYDFGKGILPDYNYTDGAARNADAGALQAAIWWFQGQQTLGGYPSPTDNVYYEYAVNTLGLTGADSANNGRYSVDVLQMWNSDGAPAQNQLVLAPDNGATLMLLSFGLVALALVAREASWSPARQPALCRRF